MRRVVRQGFTHLALYDKGDDAMRITFCTSRTIAISSPRLWSGTTLQDAEREYIFLTVRESGGVIAGAHGGAAAKLGMKRTTWQSRMQELGIARGEYEA